MTKYYVDGTRYLPMSEKNLPLVDTLPAATYILKHSKLSNTFYLDQIDNFSLPEKLYGKIGSYVERIMHTATSRDGATGALLVGEKGSGKTLLAMALALAGQDIGWPTVLINAAYGGDNFLSFIRGIDTPCVVIFDEFEKVYGSALGNDDDDDLLGKDGAEVVNQDGLLTLLNGVYSSKNLFILTANDKYKISSYLKNRPGRLHYMIDFAGLDEDFILDYCADVLDIKENAQGIVNLARMFEHFNFDMLQALVEEMNRYGETAQEAVKLLNINAFEDRYGTSYSVELFKNGKVLDVHSSYKVLKHNPLSQGRFNIYGKTSEDGESEHINFEPRELVLVDKDGNMTFRNAAGFTVELKKNKIEEFDYSRVVSVAL
jgi:hypothetical protein